MRNQVSGAITLDVAALADVIADTVAERLGTSALTPAVTSTPVLPLYQVVQALEKALPGGVSTAARGGDRAAIAADIVAILCQNGYDLTPSAQTTPLTDRDEGWFNRTEE